MRPYRWWEFKPEPWKYVPPGPDSGFWNGFKQIFGLLYIILFPFLFVLLWIYIIASIFDW